MKVMVSEGSFEGVASIEGMVSVKGVLRDTFFFFFFLRFLSGMLFGLFSTWHDGHIAHGNAYDVKISSFDG